MNDLLILCAVGVLAGMPALLVFLLWELHTQRTTAAACAQRATVAEAHLAAIPRTAITNCAFRNSPNADKTAVLEWVWGLP